MKIHKLTKRSIAPYGRIIDASGVKYKPGDNGFGVIFKERSAGWRVAYLVVRERRITRLENHPNTAETFEPVRGAAVMALAANPEPEKFKLFLLDKPIIVKKGVWHNVAARSKNCEIKICEGIKVIEKHHRLTNPIKA
jgi:ureidoglycolate hydrolase